MRWTTYQLVIRISSIHSNQKNVWMQPVLEDCANKSDTHMEVYCNGAIQKWMVYNGKSYEN